MAESRGDNMTRKKNLLSIGNLAKLSGVSIKSLRYYDRLGILKPAYTDRDSGYRYYTFSQLYIVEAIKVCLELDIPLKDFTKFSEETSGRIYYTKLLEHGRQVAEKKIKTIRDGLQLIDEFQEEIRRTEIYNNPGIQKKFFMPDKIYCVAPYEEDTETESYNIKLNRLMLEIVENGMQIGYETGLLYRFAETETEKFVFVELLTNHTEPHAASLSFLKIPACEYLCQKASPGAIKNAPALFPGIFSRSGVKIVIETELFTGEYHYAAPAYELRCSVPL